MSVSVVQAGLAPGHDLTAAASPSPLLTIQARRAAVQDA